MDLLQLEHFLAVVEERTFTRAAERVSRTQLAVSQSIKKLEEEVGASLFARDVHEVSLTEAGRVLADYARQMVGLRDQAMRQVARLQSMKAGSLTIAAYEAAARGPLPAALRTYVQRFPDIRVGVYRSRLEDIPRQAMESREIDLGLREGEAGVTMSPAIGRSHDRRDGVHCVTASFARRPQRRDGEGCQRRALRTARLCSATAEKIVRLFEQHSTRCRVVAELWSFENIKQFVTEEVGLAIVPGITVRQRAEERDARQDPAARARHAAQDVDDLSRAGLRVGAGARVDPDRARVQLARSRRCRRRRLRR